MRGKNLLDAGAARRRLDLGIGIGEGDAEPLRQPTPDAGLAGTHQANQRDGFRSMEWRHGR